MKLTVITIVAGKLETVPKVLEERLEELEKSPGDPEKLAVTQTPVKNSRGMK